MTDARDTAYFIKDLKSIGVQISRPSEDSSGGRLTVVL